MDESIIGVKRSNDNDDSDLHKDKRQRSIETSNSNSSSNSSIKNDNNDLLTTAATLEAQVAAQLAAVNALLNTKTTAAATTTTTAPSLSLSNDNKKPAYKALLLDSLGREIDENGNLVKHDINQIKSLKANVNIQQKKDNPYLAHRKLKNDDDNNDSSFIDHRLSISNKRSDARAKKSLSFVEEGKYIQQEEEIRAKEERKIVSGYASGRKAIEKAHRLNDTKTTDDNDMDTAMDEEVVTNDIIEIPPPADGGIVPILEWWDEVYIAKNIREDRKKTKAAYIIDDYELLQLTNVKTWKYVQHPVSIKPLGGEKVDVPLPMFLTKKERKRIRKTERAVREQEKRDKQMMGLIPVPEPKFKLSNFMKVLGDQAVADPSKVEMRVVQQMKQRQLNHEMRNQAAKKTPAEKWAKKMKKYQEDTTRQVSVACFSIKDLSNPSNRYKVDVNAQLYYLSGTGMYYYHFIIIIITITIIISFNVYRG